MLASCILVIGSLGVLPALATEKTAVSGTLLPRACSNPQGPNFMFTLDEARPDAWLVVNGTTFQVSQQAGVNGGRATARKYLLVHFPATPFGEPGCELSWNTPEGTSAQLQVKAAAYNPPFRPTWANVVPGLSSGMVGGGYGLAFVFKLADAVEAAGAPITASFDIGGSGGAAAKGPVLRYGC